MRLLRESKRIRGKTMNVQAQVLDFGIPILDDTQISLSGIWTDFIESIAGIDAGQYGNEAEMHSVLQHNMILMHRLLMTSQQYRSVVNENFQKMVRTKYWGWKSVHEDHQGQAGLFSIYRNAPVPLHDHPGTCGVLMVLQGEVEIDRFTLDESYRRSPSSGMVEIECIERRVLKPFELSWFGPDKGNIHGLHTRSEQSVMLKVQLPANVEASRSWYFPVFDINQGQSCTRARRILSRYL